MLEHLADRARSGGAQAGIRAQVALGFLPRLLEKRIVRTKA
jgi:hypothetical protein